MYARMCELVCMCDRDRDRDRHTHRDIEGQT